MMWPGPGVGCPAWRRVLIAALLAGVLAACSPPIHKHGNKPEPEVLAEIQPGVDDRDTVAELLGTPSSIATFDDRIWYYISKRTEQFAFFEPEVLDQQVVAILFDDEGVVREIRLLGQEDGREIELVEDETPTRGKSLTFVRQVLNTLGMLGRDPLGSDPVYDTSAR